ncbi:hydroxyacylglutathione hydrolase [Afipia felis]|uniref:Hydroxyacylglutathione hydrolase n=2 Tax=Afipia felis TaxID=1035 RepID=A0A380W4M2_AFIFE|nr:hydroxyacylglutathione hydrolase [Afipia felis]EKS31107.1 hydroxyacylglutathione hydrolase [Afipia felis ATCC 53690]SUU75851.1 Hydroxyacylglutathione hydrolase [Afipia felis]SUU83918.1 Hydroxyacylglutathione hydrolase [Afipia felis]
MDTHVKMFSCLSDNFGCLIHDDSTNTTVAIDAPEAGSIIEALEKEGWSLSTILITHHHEDHVGGVDELKARYKCGVIAPHDQGGHAIANVDRRVVDGNTIYLGNLTARVMATPGHTLDHVTYVFDNQKLIFAADLLFSLGCGRVLEGDPAMMWASLLKVRALPDDYWVYCGHEYTQSNAKFALSIDPDNLDLRRRAEQVDQVRAAGKPTLPVRLGDEKRQNVFLRADEPSLARQLGMEGAPSAKVFGELRERKNRA